MTTVAGQTVNTYVSRAIFLFTIAFLGACGQGEKPVRQPVQETTEVEPLPLREWYPSPKHMATPHGSFSSPTNQSVTTVHTQPSNQGYMNQQPWINNPAPQPVYVQQPPAVIFYQGQQYVPAPVQQGWSSQQPATQPVQPWYQPQQYVMPAPQTAQRPWGNPTVPAEHGRTKSTYESWPPPNTYYTPGGTQADSAFGDSGNGEYWTVPPANFQEKVW